MMCFPEHTMPVLSCLHVGITLLCTGFCPEAVYVQVEIHEEGVVAMLLEDANPHSSIECGKILALVCESEDDVPKVQALVKEKVDASKFTGREAAWQAYFKAYAQDSCL